MGTQSDEIRGTRYNLGQLKFFLVDDTKHHWLVLLYMSFPIIIESCMNPNIYEKG